MLENKENERLTQTVTLKRYMDVGDVAEYLGVSKWLIYKMIESRDIPFVPFGRLIRFDRLAIDRWAERRTVQAAPRRRAGHRRGWNKTEGSDVVSMEPVAIAGQPTNC